MLLQEKIPTGVHALASKTPNSLPKRGVGNGGCDEMRCNGAAALRPIHEDFKTVEWSPLVAPEENPDRGTSRRRKHPVLRLLCCFLRPIHSTVAYFAWHTRSSPYDKGSQRCIPVRRSYPAHRRPRLVGGTIAGV